MTIAVDLGRKATKQTNNTFCSVETLECFIQDFMMTINACIIMVYYLNLHEQYPQLELAMITLRCFII